MLGGGPGDVLWREAGAWKLKEQYLAVQLTKVMDKETVLVNYLNTINLGNNTLGVKMGRPPVF